MKFGKTKNRIRKAVVAGKFYPEAKAELTKDLDAFFKEAQKPNEPHYPLQAIVSPHAGYMFSGKIAASAFNQISLTTNYKRVFILASSHQFLFDGAAPYTLGNYETPLGEIEVDTELSKALLKSSSIFKQKPEAHEKEHSLEVQLPFLQKKLVSKFKLVPIILGTNSAADCKELAQALQQYFVPENLFIVSTDFSHYPSSENANKIDLLTTQAICKNNPQVLLDILEKNENSRIENLTTSLCGWTSVLTMLYLSQKGNYRISEVDYQNSGDAKFYGDKKRVVGYSALAIHNLNAAFQVSDKERNKILEITRQTITNYLNTGESGKSILPKTHGILNEKTGAFVSVYVKNELRGCIGGFAQEKKLIQLLQEMALSSISDRRFEAVRVDELNDLSIEVSILSPLKKINTANEIELGKHGIYIKCGYNTGTFLPQVANKTGWNTQEFLGHCSRDKAGLGWNGWKTAELFTYEAIIIKEKPN